MNKWYFPLSNNTHTKGLKDSGIETFKGEILGSLTREIVQNSLDAKISNADFVTIEFKYFLLENDRFPDKENFVKNLLASKEESLHLHDTSTSVFFDNALKVIIEEKVPFLRVSDFNTTGLRGSKTKSISDWKNLVMSSGISNKNANAGGSFGIGKNAAFSCSDLYTVLYSTLDIDGVESHQGIANLISIPQPHLNDHTNGYGYYSSNEMNDSINGQADFDNDFVRKDSGTDIYIAGFKYTDQEMVEGVIKGILDNFLYAIFKETLVVIVQNYKIDKTTLATLVNLNKSILNKETYELFELLYNPKTIWYNDFNHGNEALLGLLIDEEGSRKITAIRKPWMKITNLDGFSKAVYFKGVFIAHGSTLNSWLRKLENPRHDSWEVDRLDSTQKTVGINLLKNIRTYINDKIIGLISLDDAGSMELIGANDFIKLIDDETRKKDRKIKDSISRVEVKQKNTIKTNQSFPTKGSIVGESDTLGSEQEVSEMQSTSAVQKNNIPNNPITKLSEGKRVHIDYNQIKIAKIGNSNRYKFFYKGENDTKVSVTLYAVDEEGNEIPGVFSIKSVEPSSPTTNIIENTIFGLKAVNGVINIIFSLNNSEKVGFGVNIYEIER